MNLQLLLPIIGTIVGAIIAALAMIINTYFNMRFVEKKEERNQQRQNLESEIKELSKYYERVLCLTDKFIRDKGKGSKEDREEFYNIEIKLKLISKSEIIKKFLEVNSKLMDAIKSLPELPEEFIPKFEDDDLRKSRISARKIAEEKREKEYAKYTSEILMVFNEMSELMQAHLNELKTKRI